MIFKAAIFKPEGLDFDWYLKVNPVILDLERRIPIGLCRSITDGVARIDIANPKYAEIFSHDMAHLEPSFTPDNQVVNLFAAPKRSE